MATTPTFNTPQGASTSQLEFVSTIRNQTLTGEIASNTVDIQVNINGDGFTSDPTLVSFDQTEFTIPNKNVFPEGLKLRYGLNTIEVRAIDVTGATSSEAIANVRILRPDDVDLISSPPTGIRLRRQRDAVEVVWAETDIPNVRGYNVYASTEPGGGTSGYFKINRDLITDPDFEEEELTEINEDTTFFDNNFAQLNVLLTEVDFNDQPIQTVRDATIDTSLAGPEVKVTTSIEAVRTTTFYTFEHDREGRTSEGFINNDIFADIPDEEPLYYVITSVVYNPVTEQEIESAYSAELVGLPLTIDTQLRDLPRRTRFDVSESYISEILQFDNEISVIPGSVVKDVFIDPFATEAERLYFIADFIRRSQSFATLLVVDELDSYKQALASALGFSSVNNVQQIIDDSFDKLAANVNVTRQGAEPSVGEVTFYTTTEPTTDLIVEEGTLVSSESGTTFQVTSRIVLPADERESYFNLQRQRWEINANIRATDSGEQGNVPAGQIRRVIGGASGLQVTNFEATRFGQDEESNQDLAERGILAFASVDAGTEKGYLSTALRQVGVFRATVVDAGDEFMMRDYDPVRNKNIGGKVDVWVQGDREVEVQDTFALNFEVEQNVRFILDSAPSDYIFVVDDNRITPSNPITQLLGETPAEQAQGFGFKNVTTGADYDLTGYSILDYNRIQLDTSITQPPVSPNDIVTGDFRFRESNQYVFSRQPVFQVSSVQSLNTGDVLEAGVNYDLYRLEDPLLEGYSTEAEDYLQITEANGIPSGQVFVVNDERHVLVGEIPEPLNNLGVAPVSVRVFNLARTVEYDGPNTSDPDFFIEEGDATTPLNITRNPSGDIGNGEEVVVDYEHDENFEVAYGINELLNDVQAALNDQRHVTADVLAKQAIENPIDLELTIVLSRGATQSQVDAEIRTNVSQLLNSKGIGESVHQSDVVRAIENTSGVDYVVVPFAQMTQAPDNFIVREPLNNAFTFLSQSGNTNLYVLQDGLNFATVDEGGPDSQHKGVFQDDLPLDMVSSFASLSNASGQALIIGSDGLIIAGFSDDPTLTAQGFNTPDEREERRLELTANKVFLALDSNDSPSNHEYSVTYVVGDDQSSDSTIELTDVSYAELGDLTITYRSS